MYWSDFRYPSLWRRTLRHLRQRLTQGWDDSDLWNLDVTIAEFVLPRLQRFREYAAGYPGDLATQEEWHAMLDDMLYGLRAIVEDNYPSASNYDQIDWERVQRGLRLFGERFRNLWW